MSDIWLRHVEVRKKSKKSYKFCYKVWSIEVPKMNETTQLLNIHFLSSMWDGDAKKNQLEAFRFEHFFPKLTFLCGPNSSWIVEYLCKENRESRIYPKYNPHCAESISNIKMETNLYTLY